jgi:hypothetical protein
MSLCKYIFINKIITVEQDRTVPLSRLGNSQTPLSIALGVSIFHCRNIGFLHKEWSGVEHSILVTNYLLTVKLLT